jgi:ABC-2 type transport system ATP-binding protein
MDKELSGLSTPTTVIDLFGLRGESSFRPERSCDVPLNGSGRCPGGSTVSEPIICVSGLTRCFGATTALASVSLSLPRGAVYGLVGANGAGKTTLIKHALGLLRPERGSVRVFGLDPVADPVGVLSRIGYLSEDHDLPGWMRVDELMRYSRAFYPSWDETYAEELRQAFTLDPTARVKNLSRGQKARMGLLVALAHRPELLVLDEPSSGLDPVVRRDILEAIMRTTADEGRTVLFSSHLLDEVERVADHVTMISEGRIVLSAPLDAIRTSISCLTVRFGQSWPRPPALDGVLRWDGGGREWTAVCRAGAVALRDAVAAWDAVVVDERAPSLDEIFAAHVGMPMPAGQEA